MNAQSARAPPRGSTTIGAGYPPSAAPLDIPSDVETVARVAVVDALLRASYAAAAAADTVDDAVNAASAAAQQRPARPSKKYLHAPPSALRLPDVVVEDTPPRSTFDRGRRR